jgi:hypothetical protein
MRLSLAVLLLACLCLPVDAQVNRARKQLPPPMPPPGELLPVPEAPPPHLVPPVLPPAMPPGATVLTLDEFAKAFKPQSGRTTYEVVVVHPCTCRPVKVCFDLPCCPRRVVCRKTEIVFRFGLCKKPVVVTFCRDGTVLVK